jgi:hypothetical protein
MMTPSVQGGFADYPPISFCSPPTPCNENDLEA